MYNVTEMLSVEILLTRMLDVMKPSYGKLVYQSGCFENGYSPAFFARIISGRQFFVAKFSTENKEFWSSLSIATEESENKFIIVVQASWKKKVLKFELDALFVAFQCFAQDIVAMEKMGNSVNLIGWSGYLVRLFLYLISYLICLYIEERKRRVL